MADPVAYVGQDVPLEVIEAAGLVAWRLRADPAAPGTAADRFGEGGGNPLVKALAAALLQQRPERLVIAAGLPAHAALFHFCRSLPPEIAVPQPTLVQLIHRVQSSARRFNHAEMARLVAAFSATAAALSAAIERRNVLRAALTALDAARATPSPRLSGSAFQQLVDAWDRLTPGTIASARERLAEAPPLRVRARVLMVGDDAAARLYPLLDVQGVQVAGEEGARGVPVYGATVREGGDPVEALAEAYGGAMPTIAERAVALQAKARRLGVDAAVFAVPFYDHPAGWAYPTLRDALAAVGVQSLLMPADYFRAPAAAANLVREQLGAAA